MTQEIIHDRQTLTFSLDNNKIDQAKLPLHTVWLVFAALWKGDLKLTCSVQHFVPH